jgi:hypothetical protein
MSEPSSKKPEPSQFEKFRAFAQQVISVPKAEIDRREAEYQKGRAALKKRRHGERSAG